MASAFRVGNFPFCIVLNILEFEDWKGRLNWFLVSKRFLDVSLSDEYHKWCCERLSKESGVYIGDTTKPQASWLHRFSELLPLRYLWDPRKVDGYGSRKKSKISVCARFRPKNTSQIQLHEDADTDDLSGRAAVSLPLHQRLALIKITNNLKSNRDALKVLAEEGDWFETRWREVRSMEGFVVSFEEKGKDPKDRIVASVHSVDPVSGRVVVVAPDIGLREFAFDAAFLPTASQKSFYETAAQPLVADFLNGYNATAIVYGQTGAGKTYSMFGRDEDSDMMYSKDKPGRGVVPRMCAEVITAIERRRAEIGIDAKLTVSYVEIFGERIFDLLQFGAPCGHSKVSAQQYVLSGAAEQVVGSIAEVEALLIQGEAQKRFAATAMNTRSSRAHTVFVLSLTQTWKVSTVPRDAPPVTRLSKFFLADLGGSEQVKKSLVNETSGETQTSGFYKAIRMREAININLGLLALKQCVEAINNGADYIPFKDSKLTALLSTGLGGDSRTTLVVCASMDPTHAAETLSALRFGEKCALIENETDSRVDMLQCVLAALDGQIASVEEQVRLKERWEVREERRVDEQTGEVEVLKVSVLTGAETEHRELAELLHRRAALTGTAYGAGVVLKETKGGIVPRVSGSSRNNGHLGFGRHFAAAYELGVQFDPSSENQRENERFRETIDESRVPVAVRRRAADGWVSGQGHEKQDQTKLEQTARRINRSRLGYAGLS